MKTNTIFIKASEVSELMGISVSCAYRIIKTLNGELEKKGYLTVHGRTSRKYFYERVYGKDEYSA